MARHGKKRKHKKSSVNKQEASFKSVLKQQVSGEAYENNEYDGDLRKHKKKCKGKKLTFWEGAILFLLLKENGVLDEILGSDDFNEFEEFNGVSGFNKYKEKDEYKEFKPSSKFKKLEPEPKPELESELEPELKPVLETEVDKKENQESEYVEKNKVSHFDFDYFAED